MKYLIGIILLVVILSFASKQIQKNQDLWENIPKIQLAPIIQKTPPKQIWLNYAAAIKSANLTNKQIFIYFHTNDCIYCKSLKANTLENKIVKQKLEKYILCDVDLDLHPELTSKYYVNAVPRCIVIDKSTKVLKDLEGNATPEKFLKWLN